jgi:hypothetical protein
MDGDTDLVGIFDSAWHHAIISDELYGDVQKNCDFSLVELSPECSADVDQYTALYRVIDIYSLYTDRCELGYPDFNYSVSPKTARGASRRRGRVSALNAFSISALYCARGVFLRSLLICAPLSLSLSLSWIFSRCRWGTTRARRRTRLSTSTARTCRRRCTRMSLACLTPTRFAGNLAALPLPLI